MSAVKLTESIFDQISLGTGKKPVKLFTWENVNNVSVQVINYGATIVSIKIPDRSSQPADIVTGFNSIEGYQSPSNPYFGATIGRFANRIANGKCKIGEQQLNLPQNRDIHHLHGGFKGFDKVLWEPFIQGNKLVLSYFSADLEEGYPGDLVVNVSFELTATNEFLIEFKASTTKPTLVNLTNHSYFNLAGHNQGADELYNHIVNINADSYLEVDQKAIPTGNVLSVDGTVFDFRTPKVLGSVIHNVPNSPGFDHNFCIKKSPGQSLALIAKVVHPESGRVLEVHSDQPGVQFYTGNFLPENPKTYKGNPGDLPTIKGKEGNYYKHAGFCLETQVWPDSPNHKNFPNSILHPGETYIHKLSYKFSTVK